MKHNANQLNWILGEIEKTGYLVPDDLRFYFDDKKLSKKHLASINKSVNFLIKDKWIKQKRGLLVFTKMGLCSWGIAQTPKLVKMMIEKGLNLQIPTWNIWATKPRKIKKHEHEKITTHGQ